MNIRPIDIASKLNISTSALRNYEAQGIVPPTERTASGYRIYTEEHVAYFETVQAMTAGYGMEITKHVLQKIQLQDVDSALRLVNEVQANLHRDIVLAEQNILILTSQGDSFLESNQSDTWKTIGEVSTETQIPSSTIRHWEKIGLITSARDQNNGYRLFNPSQIRKIMLLRTLRSAEYSNNLVELKQAIGAMDPNDIEHAITIAKDSLSYLNTMNQELLRGGYFLYRLCRLLKLLA